MDIVSENCSKVYKIKKRFFKFENINVVEDFNYSINQGEIIGIVGKERSGKSTIINLLSGKVLPTKGKIFVDGEVNYKKLRENCEIISDFKERKLIFNESVYNNFVYFGSKYKVDALSVEKNISTLREIFELDNIINKKISELKNLDLIKTNITISMLKSTQVLFFDSSLSELNVIERNIVLKMLKRLNKEYKTTIIIGCSNLIDVEKICKRITIIKKGEIIRDDSYENIKKELCKEKEVRIVFNKSVVVPKGDFEILENSDYVLKIKIDFDKCDFKTLIQQFDVNTIVDINISNILVLDL